MNEDGFAQTRAPDDLFDDDFTPIEQPATVPVQEFNFFPPTQSGSRIGQSPHVRGSGHYEGRGRAGHGVRREGQFANPQPAEVKPTDGREVAIATEDGTKEEPSVSAVKGDRSGTGGVKKAKLTDTELAERLASIKLKNAAREEAHRRAEADEASFQQREQQELVKRKEERQNRQIMEGERERNRLRKMKALGGREWDAEKQEADMVGDRRPNVGQFRRGAHGGVVGGTDFARGGHGDGRQRQLYVDEEAASGRDQGVRGRGNRGRGRGRGSRGGAHPMPSRHQPGDGGPDIKAEADFPSLPTAVKAHDVSSTIISDASASEARSQGTVIAAAMSEPTSESVANVEQMSGDSLMLSPEGKKDWAEEMENKSHSQATPT